MLNDNKYVILSLEQHLFFARIMKEHSLFLEAGFTPKNTKLSKEADSFKVEFEKLLLDTVKLSNGIVRESILDSGEIITEYTLSTEKKTEYFTGIPINKKITMLESKLDYGINPNIKPEMINIIKKINKKAIKLLDGLIDLKVRVLNGMLSCEIFTVNYPLLIEHIIREAKLYRAYIVDLENGEDIEKKNIKQSELFWDQIMMEHALFIRGLLDPSENKLIEASDKFAKEYAALIEKAKTMTDETISSITLETLNETIKLNEFKQAGTKGIDECKIKAIFLPLLADHVLRESNHFIRLLNDYKRCKD
ncbi:DUF2935 domain-containing protein [Clostridium gasigenes]|uniref:DUF2935 domain-containing protein n=1 Tax=Clostridium gasigenes TaxID=94869 RepID=UPI0014384732|nr:DUF2935 domain-containing protein [Clostridium gasigenes]MBB6623191.1 DUF2935 domain-containing protein [Clostridium gasigenes]MBU3087957.1 DUF2935 domain-containing protein [Clostridium gasigenes]MBU3132672.1 DUF2935 domain-containing protein [Clostridium gasigenes]MBU3135398.1 DUF2935 domain-containing protein [Clostridium gasigenes]NKF05799.1 DUF2935 domain-containing protein [Clostridium gasigenes]